MRSRSVLFFFLLIPPATLGTTLSAIHFVPGQYVDIVAKS